MTDQIATPQPEPATPASPELAAFTRALAPTDLIPLGQCPVCGAGDIREIPADWQDQVAAGAVLQVIECGNPWHYATPTGRIG